MPLNGSADGITGIARVSPDSAAAVELPMRCLAELGHTAVAFLSAPRELMADPDRLRHFRRVARELGIRPRVMYSLLTMADVQRAATAVLSGRHAPAAIITNSDYTALAVYKAARALSLPIGPGVSVVGHDDLPTSELLDPPLATIRMDQRAMGRAVMRLLEPGPQEDYIAPVELVRRASLQAPDHPPSGRAHLLGAVVALDGLDLTIGAGELVALLGPSGCGKTTTLRLLAGLEDADTGRITVAGRDITRVRASKRDMGMVFQAYSLFPHMTAQQNVAFGLRLRRVPATERDRRALDMLDLVGLSTQADRYPHQVSGGQQQRIVLARALAIEPQVLLLDEPLSALDAKVRAQLRDQIRRIQLEVGITTLFVTHDQEEALAIADRVGVMREGRIEQLASPTEVYSRPATAFVAEFVGLTNRLAGMVSGSTVTVRGCALPLVDRSTPAGAVTALVRPEAVTLASDTSGEPGALTGTVIATTFLGATSRMTVDLGDVTILAQLPTSDATAHPAGSRVALSIRPDPVLVAADSLSASEG